MPSSLRSPDLLPALWLEASDQSRCVRAYDVRIHTHFVLRLFATSLPGGKQSFSFWTASPRCCLVSLKPWARLATVRTEDISPPRKRGPLMNTCHHTVSVANANENNRIGRLPNGLCPCWASPGPGRAGMRLTAMLGRTSEICERSLITQSLTFFTPLCLMIPALGQPVEPRTPG